MNNNLVFKISEELLNNGNENLYEKVGMAPTFSNMNFGKISQNIGSYDNLLTTINDYKIGSNGNNIHNEIAREMIKVSYCLDGKGLYNNFNGHIEYYKDSIKGNVFDAILKYGKKSNGYIYNNEYVAHHINSPSSRPDLVREPNNIVLITSEQDQQINDNYHGNTTGKLQNYDKQLKDCLFRGNLYQIIFGLLSSICFGFIFGFLISFIESIVMKKFIRKEIISKASLKLDAKASIKSGLTFALFSTILYLPLTLIYTVVLPVINIYSENFAVYQIIIYLSSSLFISIGFIIYNIINTYRKTKDIKTSLKKCLPVLIMISLGFIVGLANGLLPDWWKILGFLISLSMAVLFRIILIQVQQGTNKI